MSRKKRAATTKGKQAPAWFSSLRVIVMLVILIGGFLGYRGLSGYFDRPVEGRMEMKLVRVADGDTIVLRNQSSEEVRVRLMGIDTPELGTAASFRSALYCAELMEAARTIELEVDPDTPRDKYNRTLGWVWITIDEKEMLLQEELIRAGLAELYRKADKSKHYPRLKLAYQHKE